MNCIFCKIINKEIPSKILYEDNDFLVFLDINPVVSGHSLVIPKKHINDITEIDSSTIFKMYAVALNVAKRICEKLDRDGCSYTINYGSLQEVKHLHLHIIPSKGKKDLSVDEVYDILK